MHKTSLYQKTVVSFLTLVAVMVTVSALGQTDTPSLRLTLQKAREIGASRSVSVQSKSLEESMAKERVRLTGKGFLPNVYGDVNLQRNLIIPVTPVPAKAFDPNAPEGQLTLLQFATNWTGNVGLNADYQVFNPEQKSRVRQERIQAEIIGTERRMEEADAIWNVSDGYIAALIAKEQLELASADVQTKTGILKMLSEQYEEGRLKLTDLNTGRADLNSAVSKQKDAANVLVKAKADLLYQLGYNPFDTADLIFEDDIDALFQSFHIASARDEKGGLAVKKLRQQSELLQEQKTAARAKYMPQLNLGAYFGSNYFDNQFDIFKDRNWHGNSFVKVGVKVPLLDWSTYQNDRQILDLQLRNNELALRDEENQSSLSYFKALKDREFYEEKFREMKNNFSLEQQNYQLTRQQFEEGRLLISDLYQADYLVQVAKNEYLKAAYNYLLSEVKVEHEMRK